MTSAAGLWPAAFCGNGLATCRSKSRRAHATALLRSPWLACGAGDSVHRCVPFTQGPLVKHVKQPCQDQGHVLMSDCHSLRDSGTLCDAAAINWVFRNFGARNCSRYLAPWRSGEPCPWGIRRSPAIIHDAGKPRDENPARYGSCAPHGVPRTSPQFAAMRKLAMNFRAILFGADPTRLDACFTEAKVLWPASHPVIRE